MFLLLRVLATAAIFDLLAVPRVRAAEPMPDLSRVDRSVRKEPAYVAARPLYGLAVFGPKADKRVWLVLDKSKADSPKYDVLYIDRNADGDLTGPGKRLTKTDEDGAFDIGEFADPATGAKHTEFKVRASDDSVMLSMRWKGDIKFGGGYPEDPETGYMAFAPSREAAPVVWVNGDAPFRFQRWYGKTLTIGRADDFKVFLGQPGRGPNTFFASQVHFLPKEEWVRATLIYRDGAGKERRLVCELKERC
jgi:hypothetical protein